MRKLLLGMTLAAVGFGVSSGWSHASDIRVIAGEITSTFKSTTALPEHLRTVPTELTPGLRVYSTDGAFLGTLSAFSHDNGQIKRVWFGDKVVTAEHVKLDNGRVIYQAAQTQS